MKISSIIKTIEPHSKCDEFVVDLRAVLNKEQLAELIKKSESGFIIMEL